jgi:hypothetical protein
LIEFGRRLIRAALTVHASSHVESHPSYGGFDVGSVERASRRSHRAVIDRRDVSTFPSIEKGGLGPTRRLSQIWPSIGPDLPERATLEIYHINDHAQTASYISASFAPSVRARCRRSSRLTSVGRETRPFSHPIAENSTYLTECLTANKFVGFTVGIPGLDLLNSGLQTNS